MSEQKNMVNRLPKVLLQYSLLFLDPQSMMESSKVSKSWREEIRNCLCNPQLSIDNAKIFLKNNLGVNEELLKLLGKDNIICLYREIFKFMASIVEFNKMLEQKKISWSSCTMNNLNSAINSYMKIIEMLLPYTRESIKLAFNKIFDLIKKIKEIFSEIMNYYSCRNNILKNYIQFFNPFSSVNSISQLMKDVLCDPDGILFFIASTNIATCSNVDKQFAVISSIFSGYFEKFTRNLKVIHYSSEMDTSYLHSMEDNNWSKIIEFCCGKQPLSSILGEEKHNKTASLR
jgi:hypothetical protein